MKTAIVTGASGGIGLECAKQLASNGYYVLGFDIQKSEEWHILENAEMVLGDITDRKDRDKLFKLVSQRKELNVLVNAAGVAPKSRADILSVTEDSYDRVLAVNTKALFFLTQTAANYMLSNANAKDERGYIVNISSLSAYTSSVSRAEYCISKAGVSMITTLFADRLAPLGILVNEIRPGIIRTSMTEGVKEKYDALIDNGLLPIKRWGTPADVARAMLSLVSGAFDYTTGMSFDVDGGFCIRRL